MEHHFDVPGDDLDRLKNQAAADNKADQRDGELSFTEVRFTNHFSAGVQLGHGPMRHPEPEVPSPAMHNHG